MTAKRKKVLIPKKEALRRCGEPSWAKTWNDIIKGIFPQPLRRGKKVMFVEEEIDEYIESLPRCVYKGQGAVTDANAGSLKRKGGRPKRAVADEEEEEPPKRRRGRPRKAAA